MRPNGREESICWGQCLMLLSLTSSHPSREYYRIVYKTLHINSALYIEDKEFSVQELSEVHLLF